MLPIATLTTLLLVAAAPIITCFSFTAPDSGTALNLSASAINIQWDTNNEQYSQVDLSFNGQETGGGGFGYSIASNLSITAGQYTWNPSNVSNALQSTKIKLATGDDFFFKAMLHDPNSSAGANVPSSNYKVTGYPFIGAAASLQPHTGAIFLALAFLTILYV